MSSIERELCDSCAGELTSTDWQAGACTQCGNELEARAMSETSKKQLKPIIYYVYDSERGKRHRAFSRTQPAFCGTVSMYSGWAHVRSRVTSRERQCRQCAESPLNGEVTLVGGYYFPVEQRAKEL